MVSYNDASNEVFPLDNGKLPIGADLILGGWKPSLPRTRLSMANCPVCGALGGNCTHWDHVIGEVMANEQRRRVPRTGNRPVSAVGRPLRPAPPEPVTADDVQEELEARADGLVPADVEENDSDNLEAVSGDETEGDLDLDGVVDMEDPPAVIPELAVEFVEPSSVNEVRYSGQVPPNRGFRSPWDDPNRPRGVYLVLPGGNLTEVKTKEHPHNSSLVVLDEEVLEVYWPQSTKSPSYRLIFPKGRVLTKQKLLQTTHVV